MRRLLMTFWICCSIASAQEWHRVSSSFCSEIKAKGAKIAHRPFTIFEAPNAETKCCAALRVKATGETERFGHFKVLGLDPGLYFLSFDLATKHVNVPISVEWQVDKRHISNDCEPSSKITVDKSKDEVKWEEWVTLD